MVKTKKKIAWKKIIIGKFDWKRPFKFFGFIYLSLFLTALFFSSYFLFPAPSPSYSKKLSNLEFISSSDETQLATRFWRAPTEKALVIYFHGNAVDIGMLEPFAENLKTLGLSTLTMDYRSYGLSEGKPSEQACYLDAEALLKQAHDLGYSDDQIILWGRSLGGGVATEIALRHTTRGLVLESSFCTAFRTATTIPILPFDKFNNLAKIDQIETPTFFLHGSNDAVIAAWHTKKLQEAHQGKNQRFVVAGAGHNDLWTKDISDEIAALKMFFSL